MKTSTRLTRSVLYERLAAAEAELARVHACSESACKGPVDLARIVREACDPEQETFVVVLLDARQKPLAVRRVALGSLSHVDVHPREVFRDAVRMVAHSIIVAHNHPSGNPEPSQADILLTRRLVECGQLIGIPVLDHVIVTATSHTSLSALGVLS